MTKRQLKRLASMVLAGIAVPALAVPPKPGLLPVTQPDGSVFMAEIMGDENFHWYKDAQGNAMATDLSDGFIRTVSPEQIEILRKETLLKKEEAAVRARKARVAPAEIKRDFPTTGTVRGLIVMAEFQDVKFQPEHTVEHVNTKVNQPDYSGPETYGSVNDYFKAQSKGVFTPVFDIVGPVTLPYDRKHYGLTEDLDGLFRDAAYQVQKEYGTDFSLYDINNDQFVDFFFVIFAGHGEAQGGGSECVWPAMKDITDYVFDSFGGMYLGVAACSCELKGGQGTNEDGVATICHEFSHILGLPDVYDAMGTGGYGMGHYDMLCYGPYNDDCRTPCNYTAMEKFTLGWIQPTVLEEPVIGFKLEDFGTTDQCAFIVNPENTNEYYTLENRQLTGFDSALPGHGLIISYCHYDKAIWAKNAANSPHVSRYEHLRIMAADNNWDLMRGEDGDPWPGTSGNTAFTDTSRPAAKWYSTGKSVECPISNIKEHSDGTITFDFMSVDAGVENISATNEDTRYFNLQGLEVKHEALTPGFYVARKGSETRRIVIR